MGLIEHESGVISVERGWLEAAFLGHLQDEDARMAWSRGLFPENYTSQAYEKSAVVKTGSGTLFGFTVRTSRASAQYIQLYDAGKVPGSGATPRVIYDLAAAPQTLGINFGTHGRRFSSGIIIVNSTTDTTYTAGSADCWFDVQYV